MKIHPLHFYLGTALLAQLAFYRAVSIELGLDELGILAQMIAIAFVIAAATRFGCENAIGRVIVAQDAAHDQHRSIGFRYVVSALLRSLIIATPVYAVALLVFKADPALLILSLLFTFNLSYSFLERALGKHFIMVLMDSRASLTILAVVYYASGIIPRSAAEVVAVLAAIEGLKFVGYTVAMRADFAPINLKDSFAGFRFRSGYAMNEMLSIVANYGFQIFLPLFVGASSAGVFFLLQRLANPLTFVLNVANSIVTSRIVRDRDNVGQIYLNSVKELALISVLLGVAAVLFKAPVLSFFDLPTYGFEFVLILGGVIMNLLTGASAPVFNNLGRPIFNSLTSVCFILSFFAICGSIHLMAPLDLRSVAWAFLLASTCKNFVVLIGLRILQRSSLL